MSLGEKLKEARLNAGKTLRDVESEAAISNGYLSQLESDKIKQPSPHHLYRLAEVYSCDYASLMDSAGYHLPAKQKPAVKPAIRSLVDEAADLTEAEAKRVREYIQLIRNARRSKPK